jgi:hypothetical protein
MICAIESSIPGDERRFGVAEFMSVTKETEDLDPSDPNRKFNVRWMDAENEFGVYHPWSDTRPFQIFRSTVNTSFIRFDKDNRIPKDTEKYLRAQLCFEESLAAKLHGPLGYGNPETGNDHFRALKCAKRKNTKNSIDEDEEIVDNDDNEPQSKQTKTRKVQTPAKYKH